MDFVPLSKREENLATEIVDAAFMVHSKLGAGLLERVYEVCFCHELDLREIAYSKQENIPIKYEELYLEDALRLDVVVDNLVICELKAVEEWHPVWESSVAHIPQTVSEETWLHHQFQCEENKGRHSSHNSIIILCGIRGLVS
jgi:GxxExxY protein